MPSQIAWYFQNCCTFCKGRKIRHLWDKSLLCLYNVNKLIFSVEGYLPSEIAWFFQNCCTFSKARNIRHQWDKSLLCLYDVKKFMFSVTGYLPPEIAWYFQNCCTFSKERILDIIGTKTFFLFIMIISSCFL